MLEWRVSTDKGFQIIAAPSAKAAKILANGKVLRIRSCKTGKQLEARRKVQAIRMKIESLKLANEKGLEGEELARTQAKNQVIWNQLREAKKELFNAKEAKKKLGGTQVARVL